VAPSVIGRFSTGNPRISTKPRPFSTSSRSRSSTGPSVATGNRSWLWPRYRGHAHAPSPPLFRQPPPRETIGPFVRPLCEAGIVPCRRAGHHPPQCRLIPPSLLQNGRSPPLRPVHHLCDGWHRSRRVVGGRRRSSFGQRPARRALRPSVRMRPMMPYPLRKLGPYAAGQGGVSSVLQPET
jgi:hypothetical protein